MHKQVGLIVTGVETKDEEGLVVVDTVVIGKGVGFEIGFVEGTMDGFWVKETTGIGLEVGFTVLIETGLVVGLAVVIVAGTAVGFNVGLKEGKADVGTERIGCADGETLFREQGS